MCKAIDSESSEIPCNGHQYSRSRFCHLHHGICKGLDYNDSSCKKQFSQEHMKQRERDHLLSQQCVLVNGVSGFLATHSVGSNHMISNPTVTAFGMRAKQSRCSQADEAELVKIWQGSKAKFDRLPLQNLVVSLLDLRLVKPLCHLFFI